MIPEFNIYSYKFKDKYILEVNIGKNNKSLNISIPVEHYHFWLLTHEKLLWTIIHKEKINPVVRTEELEGTMTHREYWQQDKNIIREDLYEYIISNQICYKGIIYSQNTKSIIHFFNQQ